jgi:hypothetical protein
VITVEELSIGLFELATNGIETFPFRSNSKGANAVQREPIKALVEIIGGVGKQAKDNRRATESIDQLLPLRPKIAKLTSILA